jgi:hypothetical protein
VTDVVRQVITLVTVQVTNTPVTKVAIENTKAVERHRVIMKNLSVRKKKNDRFVVIVAVEKIRRRKRKKKRKK